MSDKIREGLLNPNMPAQEMRLHMGEMTAQEIRTARAAIGWANSRGAHKPITEAQVSACIARLDRILDDERDITSDYVTRTVIRELGLVIEGEE